MSVRGGPDIIEDGLVFCVDAANQKSYTGTGTTWRDISNQKNHGTLSDEAMFSDTGAPSGSTVTDIDGNIYNIVQIGKQYWMAENLKVTHYNDGTAIPFTDDEDNQEGVWQDLTTGSFSFGGEHLGTTNDSEYEETYGYLYNWYAVNGVIESGGEASKSLAPAGWRVPTNEEHIVLEDFITNDGYAGGNALKEIGYDHWNNTGDPAENGIDIYGFTALPGGYRAGGNGYYYYMGYYGYFWSSTEYNNNSAWVRVLSYSYSGIYRGDDYKESGLPVRCIYDGGGSKTDASMTFDGSSDYVEIYSTFNYITDKLMVSGWIYPKNTNGGAMSVLGKYKSSGDERSYAFYIDSNVAPNNNKFDFWVSDDGDNRHSISAEIEENKWQFFVGTFDNGSMKIYIDGELNVVGEAPFTTIHPSEIPFQIGHVYQAGSYFEGKISMVQVYNRALSNEEVQQNYNALKWRFA